MHRRRTKAGGRAPRSVRALAGTVGAVVRRCRTPRRVAVAADRGVLRRTDHQLRDLRDRRIRGQGQPGLRHGERVHVPARHSATTAGARRPGRPAADRLGRHRHAPARFWDGGWRPSRLERLAIRISCEPVIGGPPSPPLRSHPTSPTLSGSGDLRLPAPRPAGLPSRFDADQRVSVGRLLGVRVPTARGGSRSG